MRPSRQEAVFRRLLGEAVRNRAHWARVLPERRGGGGPHRSREEDGKRNQILAEGGAERLLARACRRPWGRGTTLPPVRVPSPTAPTLSPRGCPSATTTTRTSRKSSIRSILFNAQRTDCVMRWGSPSEKATGDYADSTKAPFLPGFAFLRRGRRCAFPEGCAHCASPWVCSGASWVCSRFAKEVAPPFPCRTARDAPAVCVRLGRRSQTWNPLFGRGQPKVRGGKDARRSTGNRGESSPSSEGSAASSPIQANDFAVSADVTVSVEPTVGSTSVTFKYKLTNDSAQTVWAVHSPAVSVMPASGRKTGVVAAMALSRSQGRQLRPAAVRGRCQA